MASTYVGMLVWVRRRNGSWWPGRVLGPEELPGSHLLSPRSGTPVKLLGREDASVDWYNIEKSKRVKAFRCGEFNDCIEKAKAFAGLPTKKREKYARREDAILHALELERQQIESGQVSEFATDERELIFDTCHPCGKSSEYVAPVNGDGFSSFINEESESPIGATQAILSTSRASVDKLAESTVSQEKVSISESELEDDITEAIPRMRGLQDFGLRIAPSKRKKANWTTTLEGVCKVSLTEDDSRALSCISKNIINDGLLNDLRGPSFALKRKSSHASIAGEENASKRRDRRRPLTQVLESSAKLSELGFHDLDSTSHDPKICHSQLNCMRQISLQHQEKKFTMRPEQLTSSDRLESQSVRDHFEAGQILNSVYGPKNGNENAVLAVDTSSNFSGYLNASPCDQGPLHLPLCGEPSALAGSGLIDTLIRRRPSSSCSFLSASAHTGSAASVNDNGLDKSSCISMPSMERPVPSANFLLWSSRDLKESLYSDKYDALGILQHSETVPSGLPCSGNSTTHRNSLHMYSFCSRNCQIPRTIIHRTDASHFDTSFLPMRSHSKSDIITARRTFLSKKPTTINTLRGHVVEEDEAESLRATTGCFEQFAVVESPLSHESDEGRDETGFYIRKGKCIPDDEASHVKENRNLSNWQAKGRRNSRGPGRRPESGYYGCNSPCFAEKLEQGQGETEKQYDTGWRCNHNKGALVKCNYSSGGNESIKALQHKSVSLGSLDDYKHTVLYTNNDPQGVSCIPRLQECSMFDAQTSLCRKGASLTLLEQNGLDCLPQQERHWFDVEVDSQVSYQKERVPLVSLMSRLNGKAVVGHPVLVERLENRKDAGLTCIKSRMDIATDIFSRSEGKKSFLQPTWKTARRTTMLRVPRSCASATGYEINGHIFPRFKQTGRSVSKSISILGKKGPQNKHYLANFHLSPPKKISKKLIKRVSLPLQKTRMLSSIAVGQNATQEHIPGMPQQPFMSCIPVKLVFKRIKEVLYGQADPVLPDAHASSVDASANQGLL